MAIGMRMKVRNKWMPIEIRKRVSAMEEIDEKFLSHISKDAERLLGEAYEDHRCAVAEGASSRDLIIIVSVPHITDMHPDYTAMYITVPCDSQLSEVDVRLGNEDEPGIEHQLYAGTYPVESDLHSIIDKAMIEVSTCDFCRRVMGHDKLIIVHQNNKCCKECEPEVKKKLKELGWE